LIANDATQADLAGPRPSLAQALEGLGQQRPRVIELARAAPAGFVIADDAEAISQAEALLARGAATP
jgi:hypothetical protein